MRQARCPPTSYPYPSHTNFQVRHMQLRGKACHRRQRFLRNKERQLMFNRVNRHCRKRKFIHLRVLRLRKKPLISENDHFEHPHLCHHPYPLPFPPPWKTLDISPPEILPQPLANLILPSGPFFTLIWGWNNSQVIIAAAFKNYLAASAILLITDPPFCRISPLCTSYCF